MSAKDELLKKRRKELMALGYKPGIVDLAMDWASGCAEGMANYAGKAGLAEEPYDQMIVLFLPPYLNDAEKWMRSFGHERGEVKPT